MTSRSHTGSSTRPTRRPNVVVFFTDQQRWDSLGLHGNPLDLTPNLDRLARRGTHVPLAFTAQPVCAPTRATLQTGLYPTTSGVYRNNVPLPETTRTLAHHFADAGYRTGYIGKWHLADQDPVPPEQRGGYDYWLAANMLEFQSDAYRATLFDNDGERRHLPGYRADAMGDAAIRYVDDHVANHADEPFFLFLSFLEPHHQNHQDAYPAPHGYAERYAGRWTPPDLAALGGSAAQHLPGYWGMVKRLDEVLGRLLDALTSLGLLDDTIVAFTTDHGCHFKTRNSEYKRSPHDASIRVPLAFQGPGFDGGGQVQDLVSLIDLPPTLLDAAGIAVPPEMQGRSILPLLRGERAGWPPDWPEDVFVQISESCVGRAIRTHAWKYAVVAPDRDGWEHSEAERYVEDCLYDLDADPYELVNLAGVDAFADVAAELRARLIRRMVEAGEAAPTIDPAPPKPADGQRGPDAGHWLRAGAYRRPDHLDA